MTNMIISVSLPWRLDGSFRGSFAAEGRSGLHAANVSLCEQVGAIQQLILMALSDNEVVVEQACKTIGRPHRHGLLLLMSLHPDCPTARLHGPVGSKQVLRHTCAWLQRRIAPRQLGQRLSRTKLPSSFALNDRAQRLTCWHPPAGRDTALQPTPLSQLLHHGASHSINLSFIMHARPATR